jgi:prepilin-type N-terminal cleavage/methylation domain-containing protein
MPDSKIISTIPAKSAFSLVELSIVLVILGLLTGGILAGQSLIRAAELRSVTTDYNKYMTAVRAFRDKYFALPGDMTNATAFWGTAGGTGSDTTCQTTVGTGTATCNGDGDGGTLDTISGTVYYYEEYRFWQHLANAGLIEGNFTGVQGAANTPGTNVPSSKISNALFFVNNIANYVTSGTTVSGGNVKIFAGDYGKSQLTFINVGGSYTTAGSWPLKPEEAWNIDTKLDDGLPSSGSVWSAKGNGTNTNCTTFAGVAPPGDAGATYLLSNSNKDCFLYFPRAF